MEIRDAEEADLPSIVLIHNDAVRTTTAIWDDDEVDIEDRRQWFVSRVSNGFPVLVAIYDGEVAGFASYGYWRSRWGYRYTVENSVYVGRGFRGKGIARMLMTQLIERARLAGLRAMVAVVDSSNSESIGLHKSLGFSCVAQMPQVGVKFGRWLDLSMLQLTLNDEENPPTNVS
ncbi:MAG: GNAT family N-acetyltransferase [Mycobacteriaceae bacterium]